MGIKELALAAGLAACGRVENAGIDANTIDAAPDALVCTAPEMLCGSACLDVTTDNNHCGSCTKQCLSNEGCVASTCIDATASCMNIQMLNPDAASGPYTHTADNTTFFCDMRKSPAVQYDRLAMGRYNGTYAGYSIVDSTQLQDATIQAAFIYWFNRQGGMPALETWTAGNVCTTSATTGVKRLQFGASLLFPAQGTTDPSTFTINSLYSEELVNKQPPIFMVAPIANNFFQTNPPTDIATQCNDSDNPALYFKKH